MSKIKIPCILGPTGAGKTAASLSLCREFSGSVINADSRQTYQDFPIITAQPSPEEQAQAPHFYYGFLATHQSIGAGQYSRDISPLIIKEKTQRLPILVGGTGLYIKTLFEGMAPIPEVPDEIRDFWQKELEAKGSPALYEKLKKFDPVYAEKIHPHDRQRVTRALEVYKATGETFSAWHEKPLPPSPFEPLYIGIDLDLEALEPRLEKRIEIMLETGAIQEAQEALKNSQNPQDPGWSGIGCAELYKYLNKELNLEETKKLWLKNTRAYAKRQLTWFRRQKNINWFAPKDLDGILKITESFLKA